MRNAVTVKVMHKCVHTKGREEGATPGGYIYEGVNSCDLLTHLVEVCQHGYCSHICQHKQRRMSMFRDIMIVSMGRGRRGRRGG